MKYELRTCRSAGLPGVGWREAKAGVSKRRLVELDRRVAAIYEGRNTRFYLEYSYSAERFLKTFQEEIRKLIANEDYWESFDYVRETMRRYYHTCTLEGSLERAFKRLSGYLKRIVKDTGQEGREAIARERERKAEEEMSDEDRMVKQAMFCPLA